MFESKKSKETHLHRRKKFESQSLERKSRRRPTKEGKKEIHRIRYQRQLSMKIGEKEIHLKMNRLREAMTQMSSTGQPLSTQKRWMVINKAIVFDNGIIPYTNDSGDGIIPILSHLCTKDNVWHMEKRIQQNTKNVEKELRRVGVNNYYDMIMASWNNKNWIYNLDINSDEQTIIRVISAYSLYLTNIGDVDKALYPMQWDYMTF